MPQLVLIPGLLCTKAVFTNQISALPGIQEPIIAKTTMMSSVTEMAENLLDNTQGQLALCGFSMGGYVALEACRLAPERIAGLALLSTTARSDSDEKRKIRQDLINLSQNGKFKGVTPRLLARFFSPAALQDKEKTEIVLSMGAEIGQDNFVRQQTAIMQRRDQRPYLGAITCPTIIVSGMLDNLTVPEDSVEMAELIPNAALIQLPDCGHMSPLEAPDEVNEALQNWFQHLQGSDAISS